MLHFLCRCSYLFTFLLSSQFYWLICLKSTAYFFDPPCIDGTTSCMANWMIVVRGHLCAVNWHQFISYTEAGDLIDSSLLMDIDVPLIRLAKHRQRVVVSRSCCRPTSAVSELINRCIALSCARPFSATAAAAARRWLWLSRSVVMGTIHSMLGCCCCCCCCAGDYHAFWTLSCLTTVAFTLRGDGALWWQCYVWGLACRAGWGRR